MREGNDRDPVSKGGVPAAGLAAGAKNVVPVYDDCVSQANRVE